MTARTIAVDEGSHTSRARRPERALRCLTCPRPVKTKDHRTVERRKGRCWTFVETKIVTECSRCGVRKRTRITTEMDDGVAQKGYVP